MLRRFLQLNHNIKLPLSESLVVPEVRNINGKYFVFHMKLAMQEARMILDESIISREKTSSTLCETPTTKGVNWCLHFLM